MADRPNILLFFTDQQRADTLGCYGQPLPISPNIDRFASEGVRFNLACTCQPVCGPARAALQTGLYPTSTGTPTNHCMLPLDVDTIAKRLRSEGYHCGYLGKWHLASFGEQGGSDDYRIRPVPRERRGGYDDWWLASDALEYTSRGYSGHMFDQEGNKRNFPEGQFRADVQTDWLLEHLESLGDSHPWLICSSWLEPHHQNDCNCYQGPHGSKEKYANAPMPGDLLGLEHGDWKSEYADYLGCCERLDHNFGRVMELLERKGWSKNTLVIYLSDHGCHFRTRNAEYKRSAHDASLRIPLILRGPGFTGGKIFNDPVSLVDIPATILRAAGVEPIEGWHSHALQDALSGDPEYPEEAFAQISESSCARAIRNKRWTYSIWVPSEEPWSKQVASNIYHEQFLYDNDADPDQLNNLIRDPSLKEVRSTLRKRLVTRMTAAGENRPEIITADDRRFVTFFE